MCNPIETICNPIASHVRDRERALIERLTKALKDYRRLHFVASRVDSDWRTVGDEVSLAILEADAWLAEPPAMFSFNPPDAGEAK